MTTSPKPTKDEALARAKEKLQLYRSFHSGEYVGGVEFTALIRMIDEAIAQPAADDKALTTNGVVDQKGANVDDKAGGEVVECCCKCGDVHLPQDGQTCRVCKGQTFTRSQPQASQLAERVALEMDRVIECAARLVEHADFKLGGILSADSNAKDIPSNAVSQVKARHLASLRDALSSHGITAKDKS